VDEHAAEVASMKGGPGKGRDLDKREGRQLRVNASMKGGPGKGRDALAPARPAGQGLASMKGGPGKGRDPAHDVFVYGGDVPR